MTLRFQVPNIIITGTYHNTHLWWILVNNWHPRSTSRGLFPQSELVISYGTHNRTPPVAHHDCQQTNSVTAYKAHISVKLIHLLPFTKCRILLIKRKFSWNFQTYSIIIICHGTYMPFILQNSHPCEQGGTGISWNHLTKYEIHVVHHHLKQHNTWQVFPPPHYKKSYNILS